MYADDTKICAYANDYYDIIDNINYDLENGCYKISSKVIHKNQLLFIASSFNIKNIIIQNSILIYNAPVSRAENYTCLGVDVRLCV